MEDLFQFSTLCRLVSFKVVKETDERGAVVYLKMKCSDGTSTNWELFETSLAVQCLRLHTSNAGGVGSMPGQGGAPPKKLIN